MTDKFQPWAQNKLTWQQRHVIYITILIVLTVLLYEEFVCKRD